MKGLRQAIKQDVSGTKHTGTTKGKSNELGGGGRAEQLREKGVPGPVIGAIARSKGVFGHNDFKKGPGKGKR